MTYWTDTNKFLEDLQQLNVANTATPLSAFAPPTTLISMNGERLIDLPDPTDPQDAATKAYLAAQIAAIGDLALQADLYKAPARVVAVANVTLSAPGATIDSVSMVSGDRVLLTNQSTGSQNGLWVWNGAAVAMTRPVDFAHGSTALAVYGLVVPILAGTVYANYRYLLTTTAAITIDSTAQAWSALPVSLTNVSGVAPVANGGVTRYAADFGNVTDVSYVITHGLNSLDIQYRIAVKADGSIPVYAVTAQDANTITIGITPAPGTNALHFSAIR